MKKLANRLSLAELATIPERFMCAGAAGQVVECSSDYFSRILQDKTVSDGICHVVGSNAATMLACQRLPERVSELAGFELGGKGSRIIDWAKRSLWGNPMHSEWPAFAVITKGWVSRWWFQKKNGIEINTVEVNSRQSRELRPVNNVKIRVNSEICIDLNLQDFNFITPKKTEKRIELWAFQRSRFGEAQVEHRLFPFRMSEFVLGLGNREYPDLFNRGLVPTSVESVGSFVDGIPFHYGTGVNLHLQLIDPTFEFSTPMWTLYVDFQDDEKQTDLIVWEQEFATFTDSMCGVESAFANAM